jgi:hypothetical protein
MSLAADKMAVYLRKQSTTIKRQYYTSFTKTTEFTVSTLLTHLEAGPKDESVSRDKLL